MGVFNASWWSVWWPSMILWSVTFAGFIACASILGVHYRRSRRRRLPGRPPIVGMCFYLHEQSVMDLFQVGRYKPALKEEVELTTSRSGALHAQVFVGGEGNVSKEIFRRYVEEAEPITVIVTVMNAMEKADGIIYADLKNQRITRNQALSNALALTEGEGAPERKSVRLRDLDDFVSVSGRFRKIGKTDAETTFLVPYGDPAEPGQGPHVRIICATDGLRTDVGSEGTFQARCLGKVLDWDPEAQELEIQPIAIFR